ncbi:MAG: DNA (cytosine-5-)-methyltransferase [Sphaerochaetaceae bacterium]|nr:DNA (cytosine-5-)-methyltransferase [Sphaerochaetaceae bacterium]
MANNRVVELFAGVGGFRIGLEKSGWKVIYGNQWEPGKKVQHAYECYESHFKSGKHTNIDIEKIPTSEIPNHELLVGGFPCQDYSVASTLVNSKGIEGKKGVLWWEIQRIVEAKKPKYILLENVDRLLKSPAKQRGRDFGIILSCLNSLGYYVEWRVINAADYGFVQRRRRVFIFATRIKKTKNKLFKKNEYKFFQSFLPIEKKGKLKHFEIPTDLLDLSNNFKGNFENSGCCDNFVCLTQKVNPIYEGPHKLLQDILESNVDEKYYIDESKIAKWKYLKGPKKIERTSKEGFKYKYAEGGIAYPDYLDRPARTMLTSEGSVNRSSHIILDPETDRLRILTPIECERINGFPDNWTNTMPERTRYFCMGNALVVPLIEIIGKEIINL